MQPVRISIVLDVDDVINVTRELWIADYASDFELVQFRGGEFFQIGGDEEISTLPHEFLALTGSYVYWPKGRSGWLTQSQLRNVALALATGNSDFALVSRGLTELPEVAIGDIYNSIVISKSAGMDCCRFPGKLENGYGKILRLLPYHGDETELKILSVPALFPHAQVSLEAGGSQVVLGPEKLYSRFLNFDDENVWYYKKNRPVVFAFPIFLAVGGVERNTIEVMARLNNDYDFVVITMERLQNRQGSLHHQADKVSCAIYDLAEITTHSNYLEILAYLKRVYRPDIVWVCNGSPWFCDNAGKIRELFSDVAIIDQEVYDVKEGWINRYHEAGIQSFDRFIAVTEKIRRVFLDQLRMPDTKIDLIYSAVSPQKFRTFNAQVYDRSMLCRQFGLPEMKFIYIFMGRLTAQKRPGLFLEIALQRWSMSDELFVLVGDGELSDEVQRQVERDKLSNVVRIKYVENTPELFALAQAMVITSAYEGLPIAMLESLCMSVPVLAADVGDIRAVLEKFGGGRVVPSDYTADQWARELQLFRDELPQYQERLKQESARVLDQFSSEAIAGQYKESWERARLQRSGTH